MVGYASKKRIDYLTVYAFSAQNWSRPTDEIRGLFTIVNNSLREMEECFRTHNIRVRIQGFLDVYPTHVIRTIQHIVETTAKNTGMVFTIALSYGGREEIVEAVNTLVQDGCSNVTIKTLNAAINPEKIPNPDLILRTSGEFRISNFLLWQCAYAEYYITNTLWPDFCEKDLDDALESYGQRHRRYGKIDTGVDAYKFPDHTTLYNLIAKILDASKHVTQTPNVQSYTANRFLHQKYKAQIESVLREPMENTSHAIAKEAYVTAKKLDDAQPESFYQDIYSWVDFTFFIDTLIDDYHIKHEVFSELVENEETMNMMDIYRAICHQFPAEKRDWILHEAKEKMYKLNDTHFAVYKQIAKYDMHDHDYILRILNFFYHLYPLFHSYMHVESLCMCAILLTLIDDIEDKQSQNFESLVPLHVLETILSMEKDVKENMGNPIYQKIRVALIYLTQFLFTKTGDTFFHDGRIFRYIQGVLDH